MKVFKSRKSGFTLIETVMALTVVALGLTPLFLTQGRITQDVSTMYASWRAVVALKNEQCDLLRTTVFNAEQVPSLPEKTVDGVTLKFKLKKINEKSSLKNIKNLQLLDAMAQWKFFGRPYTLKMLSGIVIPEKQESEQEGSKEGEQKTGKIAPQEKGVSKP